MKVFDTYECWDRLKNKDKPILIYGMGNGADKILSVFEKNGISVDGFFASDGFVRGHLFHNMRVTSYKEACETFGDFIAVIAFGSSLPDVMNNMRKINAEKECFAPDVPVAGNELFNAEFYIKNEFLIDKARNLFADERSAHDFDEIIKYKLDGKISHFSIDSPKENALQNILSGGYSAYLDLGAYNGDTIKETLKFFPEITKATAFEPSPRIFKKLSAFAETLNGIDIDLVNACALDTAKTVGFRDGAGRNSQVLGESEIQAHDAKSISVNCISPSEICKYKNEKLLIKLDVEGDERAALSGLRELMSNNECELIVSAYHRSGDIFELPIYIHELLPNHKIFLRKHPYIPAWDINLYITK